MVSILATLDQSPHTSQLVPVLINLAGSANAKVKLLTVVFPPTGISGQSGETGDASVIAGSVSGAIVNLESIVLSREPAWIETLEQATARVFSEVLQHLAEVARPLRDEGLAVETEVVSDASEAQGIIAVAVRDKVDIIAMVSTDRRGKATPGSVQAKVLSSGVAPVLLVQSAA